MALAFKGLPDNIADWRRELIARIPDLDMRVWPDIGDPAEIDVAFMFKAPPGEFRRYPNLRAILNLGVGVDPLLADPTLPPGIPISRIVDPSLTRQMSSYLVYGALHYHRRFDLFARQQRDHRWGYERARNNAVCHVGVMGMGVLGAGAAVTLRDLGFQVAGWSRTPKAIDGIESFHGNEALPAFMARTDILCCVLPLTPQTIGILNAESLAWLRPGARLINIARGAHVVEPDLLAALASGQIGGAMLDVVSQEPLPPENPLWTHPHVIITPHIAGNTTPATAADLVAENILRARRGAPLLNEVHPDVGY